jgi:hypothetical protein
MALRIFFKTLCAAIVAMALASTASAAPSARGLHVLPIVGPVSQQEIDSQMNLAKSAHANTVRAEVRWDALQPNPGAFDQGTLAAADALVNSAANRGMKVLLMVDSTPCWASDAPANVKGDCSTAAEQAAAASYGPSDPAQYGAVAAFLSARYGSRLAGFEVWNEPDQANEQYLAGPDKAARYANILKAAYTAIKGASPSTKVLGGTFVGSNGNFLRALYAQGIKGYYDILSVHFYDETLYSIRETRKVQKANGDNKPMWLGEFGYSSCYPKAKFQGGQNCVSRKVQALKLGDVFRGLRKYPYVQGAMIYQIFDSSDYDMGLFDQNGLKKPSFAPVSKIFAKSKIAKPRKVKLKLKRSGNHVVASGSGPGADFYELSVAQGGHLRYRAIVKLSRSLTFKAKLPSELGTSGLRVKAKYLSGGSATKRI